MSSHHVSSKSQTLSPAGEARRRKLRLGLISVGVLLLVLFVTGALIYLNRSRERDRILMEFTISRAASLLTEAHLQGVPLSEEQLPSGVLAFGIYGPNGESELRLGRAPARLERQQPLPYALALEGDTLRLLRPVGRLLPLETPGMDGGHHMEPRRRMPMGPWRSEGWGMGGPGGMHMGSPGIAPQSEAGNVARVSYTEYDVSTIQGRSRQLFFFIALALLTTVVLFGLLLVIARRLQLAEAKVQESRRLAELGEAARTLTHEIRNPLGALKMQASLLKRTLPTDQSEAATLLDEEIGRISYLVERVREFLKNPEGRPESVECAEFLRGLRLGEDVRISEAQDSLWIRIDPEKLRSAVENLVANAREANRETGYPGEVEVSTERHGQKMRFLVCDRGPGIQDENGSRIFEPFFTTKSQGSGVGLAISRRFVEAAGGRLTFHPREGGGTCFYITLPLIKEV